MKGYLDRIEENEFAVILVDDMQKEFIIPKAELPEGSTEKSYFELTIENDKIVAIKLDEQTSQTEQQKVDDILQKLRSKGRGSKFKKK